MLQTSARLLRLLSRLQARRDWSGPELAERLGVSTRTHAPAALIAGRLPPAVLVEAVDEHTCIVNVGSDTPQMLAVHLGMLDVDFEAVEPPELVEQLRTLADRYRRAIITTGSGT